MDLVTVRRWINLIFIVTGSGLTLYVAIAVLGFVRNSSVHYTSFVLVTLIMAALLSFQKLLDAKILGSGTRTRFWGLQVLIAIVAAALAIGGAAYLRIHAVRLETIQPFFPDFDIWIGLLLLVGIMLLNWIHWGGLLTSMIIASILYFFYGDLIPNPILAHPDYDVSFVMHYMGLGITDGIFWFAMLAVDSIYFLLIYAAILLGVGMLKMVIEIGKVTGRRLPGGAAFPAIIGSGIVASVMGQAVTNVMLTGRLTIPMMKSHGYRKEMAGAVEAVASCSGQIMPPVLGLAGFIIAQFLNIAYIDVALAALIPALLFLTGIGVAVVVSAYRERLPKLHEPVDIEVIKRLLPPFLISFGAVLILLLGYYSPAIAGLTGVILALLMAPLQGKYRPKLKDLYVAFEDGLTIVTILSLLLYRGGAARADVSDDESRRQDGDVYSDNRARHPLALVVRSDDCGVGARHGPAHPRCLSGGRDHAGAFPAATGRPRVKRPLLCLLLCGFLVPLPTGGRRTSGCVEAVRRFLPGYGRRRVKDRVDDLCHSLWLCLPSGTSVVSTPHLERDTAYHPGVDHSMDHFGMLLRLFPARPQRIRARDVRHRHPRRARARG